MAEFQLYCRVHGVIATREVSDTPTPNPDTCPTCSEYLSLRPVEGQPAEAAS